MIPHPPDDVVLACHLRRKFRKDGQDRVSDQASNVYFKLHKGFSQWEIMRRVYKCLPNIAPFSILLHHEAILHLTEKHGEQIIGSLGLVHLKPYL